MQRNLDIFLKLPYVRSNCCTVMHETAPVCVLWKTMKTNSELLSQPCCMMISICIFFYLY